MKEEMILIPTMRLGSPNGSEKNVLSGNVSQVMSKAMNFAMKKLFIKMRNENTRVNCMGILMMTWDWCMDYVTKWLAFDVCEAQ